MPNRSELLRSLFHEVIELPADARRAFLESRCGDDADLRTELDDLLAHHEKRPQGYLDERFVDVGTASDGAAAGVSVAGRYKLRRVLGEGGMGIVWLADQERPRREVALKLVRPGLAGRELLRRFELEAAVLGRLNHPGIAQIHEAGMFDDGSGARPFFAMELVDGLSLTDYAVENALDTRARLSLLARVCDAVHHAHQKGIIHRDLKPANILVTRGGDPKVLDFGVARATDADLQVPTVQTEVGRLVGTLAYMSPEQVEGSATRLDTRSDVYALGVVLYELLGERLPHAVGGLSIAQAARVITEEDPAPLSTISRAYRGDLNTIVLKALEIDPDRRYQSAADLGADIRRYLNDQPIVARPATTVYQLRKFAKRNRALVVGVTAAILALAVGLVGTTVGMVRARESASRALAMNAFMEEILTSADVDRGDAEIKLVEVLERASGRASGQFAEHPDLEADVRQLLGTSFLNLSHHIQAIEHLERAYEIRHSTLGPGDALTLASAYRYAEALVATMRLDEAMLIVDEIGRYLPERDQDTRLALEARRIRGRVLIHRREHDAAAAELRVVVVDARAALGPDDSTTLLAQGFLAKAILNRVQQGGSRDADADLAEAETLFRDAFERRVRVSGAESRATIYLQVHLAEVLREQGRGAEAEPLVMEAVARADRFGQAHDLVMQAHHTLVRIRIDQNRYAEAAALQISVLEQIEARLGENEMTVISNMSDGLGTMAAAGRWATGERYARTVHERFLSLGEYGAALAHNHRLYLAYFLSEQRRLAEADEHFAGFHDARSEDESSGVRCRHDVFYGAHLVAHGRYEEAERSLRAALDGCDGFYGSNWLAYVTRRELAELYEAWGKPELADRWRAELTALGG